MKIAVTSQNFRTITGHAGNTRRFLVFDEDGNELERLDLPKAMSMHEWRGGDDDPHPLDAVAVVITASCGVHFPERLARRGIRVEQTAETDPVKAVRDYLQGCLQPPDSEAATHDDH
jgi:predicted Fe-Mo cluster-binding NifX family protein